MRRIVIVLGLLLGAGALLLAALPWWLGAALESTGARTGLTFAAYERIGYGRFALVGARWQRDGVTVTADRLEAPAPLLWLWGDRSPVVAGEWAVEIAPRDPAAKETSAESMDGAASGPLERHGFVPTLERISEGLVRIAPWLPTVVAGPGEMRAGGVRLTVASATLRPRALELDGLRWRRWSARVEVGWKATSAWTVLAENPADGWKAEASGEVTDWTGSLRFRDQLATGEAQFATEGWLPRTASLHAVDWTLTGDSVGLGNLYADLRGEVRVEWQDRRLEYAIRAEGTPREPESSVPPLQVDLRGGGAWNDFLVETAQISVPGLNATLSAPVRLRPAALAETGESTFTLEADPAAWPGSPVQGRLAGEAVVRPQSGGWPAVAFEFRAEEFNFQGWPMQSGELAGELRWPQINVERLRASTPAGSAVDATGSWHFRDHRLNEGTAKLTAVAADLASHLPEGVLVESVTFEATAAGVWPALAHAGTATWMPLTWRGLNPVSGRVAWSGEGEALSALAVSLEAKGAQIEFEGSLDRSRLRLASLVWTGEGQPALNLRQPAELIWSDGVRLTEFALAGESSELVLAGVWGGRGEASVTLANVASTRLRPWLSLPGPDWRVENIVWSGRWPEGILQHEGSARFELSLGDGRTAGIDLAFKGGADGQVVERLGVAEGGAAIVQAQGSVPLVVHPSGAPRIQAIPKGRFDLKARSEPNEAFWARLADLVGVRLEAPRLSAEITGTWADPRGFLELSAERVALEGARWPKNLPELGGLRLHVAGDGHQVALEDLTLAVAGQSLRAQGVLPLTDDTWAALRGNPLDHLRREAEGRIEIPDADMGAFARLVPSYLAPSGRLQASLALRRGGDWDGYVRLRGAASRPLGPLGVLQEIAADLRLSNRTLQLREVSARVGGQPVVLAGEAELPLEGGPRLNLTLKGENLPFVRQTGLLLRGDLDLTARTDPDGITRLAGGARLRDSLFLADLLSLLPGAGTAPSATDRRPPYFAVGVPPLDAWALDIDVQGERFLRLRTPVFTGEASARFKLGGTLGSPRAVGEATIDSGSVLLPFATFRVTQGWVRLSEADPYTPMLSLTGTGRRFGYDLRLELDGAATAPSLRFSSSPPLGSEDVLLMVMAGEPPNDEITYTGRQRFVRLGTYLGQSLFRGLGGDAGAAERFSLTAGERVSRQGRETYGFSYELDSRWSLVGEYDEFDDYNVGLKWRVLGGQGEGSDER